MHAYEVVTTDGNTIHIEHSGATPATLAQTARNYGHLEASEVVTIAGREPRRNPIAIAYHAIALIRPKGES
jgi:hypothetical protein